MVESHSLCAILSVSLSLSHMHACAYTNTVFVLLLFYRCHLLRNLLTVYRYLVMFMHIALQIELGGILSFNMLYIVNIYIVYIYIYIYIYIYMFLYGNYME